MSDEPHRDAIERLNKAAEAAIQQPGDGVWCSCCRRYVGNRATDGHDIRCLADFIMKTRNQLREGK